MIVYLHKKESLETGTLAKPEYHRIVFSVKVVNGDRFNRRYNLSLPNSEIWQNNSTQKQLLKCRHENHVETFNGVNCH